MPRYEVEVTVCEKCGETRIRYPWIEMGKGTSTKASDVLCQCEQEEIKHNFSEMLEKMKKNLNAE